MKFEVLKRSHLKRNIIIGVIAVMLISAIILNFTRAKYKVTQSIPLVNGTINYSLADFNAVAIYIENDSGYEQTDAIPESGYAFNEEESYCTVNNERDDSISISYNVDTKALSVTPMTTKGTKCYLYFDELVSAKETILANYPTVLTRNDFSTTVTDTTTGTIYKSLNSSQYDDYGEVYYFAGNPTDNWLYFGGFYWRIIRINGNGTIRIIYSGDESSGPVTTGTATQIEESAFNPAYDNNMYVGYMYQNNQVHGLEISSTIKGVLDTWYQNNLLNLDYKIDGNTGFCGDRSPSTSETTSNGKGGTGTTNTFYGAYIRKDNNKKPTYECSNKNDLYTTKYSDYGNNALTYPIGLISADEVWYAGEQSKNINNYLYTNCTYATMSPLSFYSGWAQIYIVYNLGYLTWYRTDSPVGVRPVINLKSDTKLSGSGTSTDPYVVA